MDGKGGKTGLKLDTLQFINCRYGKHLKKEGWVRLSEEIYTLMYADDVALMAEEEQDMRSMKSRLEEYLDKKELTLSTEKTIMRKGGRRKKKYEWRWKGKNDRGD